MKPPLRPSATESGVVMIYALLVIIAGAFVLAAWAQLMATQAINRDQAIVAQNRRIAVENGRSLAQQYLLERLPAGTIAGATYAAPGGWGGFTITAPGTSVFSSTEQPTAINPFSPGERFGFSVDITATISDDTNSHGWRFRARTENPAYAGYLLTTHQPATDVSGTVEVQGTSLLWPTAPNLDYVTVTYQAPASRTALHSSGAGIITFPFVPLTSGTVSGFDAFAGYLSVSGPTGGVNEVADDPLVTTDGIQITDAGTVRTVTLDLGVLNLQTFPVEANALIRYQVSSASVSGISSIRLRLIGGTTATMPPLIVTYSPGTLDLTSVSLEGNSTRRFYLQVQKSTPTSVGVTTTGSASFRMAATFRNTPLAFAPTGALTLVGGIRSDSSITSTTDMDIVRETSPAGLRSLADRMAWLEGARYP